MKSYHINAYRYMEKLMTENLHKIWVGIIEEQCNQLYINLKDAKQATGAAKVSLRSGHATII